MLTTSWIGPGEVNQEKEVSTVSPPTTILGGYCFDSSVDWIGNQSSLLCQMKSGEVATLGGHPPKGFRLLKLPPGVANYVVAGLFERNPQTLREKYYVRSLTKTSNGFRSSSEAFAVDSSSGATKSLIKVGGDFATKNFAGKVQELYGPAISPSETLEAYWVSRLMAEQRLKGCSFGESAKPCFNNCTFATQAKLPRLRQQ